MTTTQPYLGRCKHCDYVIFATPEQVLEAASFSDVKPGGVYTVADRNGVFSRCNLKHTVFPLKRIKGTYSKDHKCDSRCLEAKGWKCTCSCGGANHGRGHAVTVHEAGEKYEARFLGEIGKHIVGEVTVAGKREVNGRYPAILFTFVTLDGTATLKWFAPLDRKDDFEVGETCRIRAKVKDHEDHERFGKSTIVNYAGRVPA